MNVVMIGPFAFKPKGTVSVRAFFMGRALVRNGHDVTILMPPYDNPADSGKTWVMDGVHLENMVLERNDLWHQLVVPLRMARRAVDLGADIVHVFKPIGYSGLAGLALDQLSNRPLVLDTDDWEGTGGWNDVNSYPALWRWFFDRQERGMPLRARAVTVASRTLQTQVWGFGVEPEHVTYLPNGPDTKLRNLPEVTQGEKARVRRKLGIGDAPFALYLGHIPLGTDLDLALEAMSIIRARMPRARLVIAGVGDGLASLEVRAQELGVADRVLFPGWVDHDQAHLYLAAADVAVNPYRDTLINRAKCAGKVVLAMAIGTAVVTSRMGENLEYIEHDRSGFLAEPGDARDLAQVLLRVLAERDLAAEVGRRARKRIWSKYDWDARVGEIEAAYELALGTVGN
jgi:glycosyltransferase involved in cell wall biosynthesis